MYRMFEQVWVNLPPGLHVTFPKSNKFSFVSRPTILDTKSHAANLFLVDPPPSSTVSGMYYPLAKLLLQLEHSAQAELDPLSLANVILTTAMQELSDPRSFDVVVTTYDMIDSSHFSFLLQRSIVWKCLVLDEGHKIKNEFSQVSSAARRIKCQHKLMLTGVRAQEHFWVWVFGPQRQTEAQSLPFFNPQAPDV